MNQSPLSGTKGDARWLQWVAKGHDHDRRLRQRVRLVTVSIGSLVALGLAIALTFE